MLAADPYISNVPDNTRYGVKVKQKFSFCSDRALVSDHIKGYGRDGETFEMRFVLAILLAVVAEPAKASWTFCVAESDSGKQIWITGVFPAARDRERLETDFKSLLLSRGVAKPVVQCPQPREDKTDAVNAQFTATEFHRKLGDALHSVSAPGFEPRR